MGDKGDREHSVCGSCGGTARSNAKLHVCDNCGKSFHTVCAKLASVTIENKQGRACPSCITRAVPSLSGQRSRTASTSSSTDAAGPSDDVLKRILNEITGLRTSVDGRFDKIEAKFAEFEGLGARVTANEADLEDVRRELTEIKQRLDQGAASTTSHSSDLELRDKVLNLEKKNADLSVRLAKVSSLRLSISTDLIIGGLSAPKECDPKVLVKAVLTTVYPDLDPRDLVTIRPLLRKDKGGDAGSNSTHNVSAATTDVTPRSDRPPPLLVTVSSRALLEAIIRGKIKHGKLHTSALAASLPSGIFDSIKPALININEFLPIEVFKLHRLVREKAKQSNAGITSFVRGGNIYVRRKKGDVATLIGSEEDLHRFLAS